MTTIESIYMPPDLIAHVARRSTLQRSGVILESTTISPAYEGQLTFGLINLHSEPFFLGYGERVAGIEFSQLLDQEIDAGYKGQWQGGRVSCSTPEKQI